MKYKTHIFDLDGTIIDSSRGIFEGVQYALRRLGRPELPDSELRKFIGPPLVPSFMAYCGMTEEEAIQATQEYRVLYHQSAWKHSRVYPGIRRLLQTLKNAGSYLGIATGKPQDATEMILKYLNLDQYFDVVYGTSHVDYHATKEACLAKALQDAPGKAVMIGDRDSDMVAAQALGCDGLYVLYGFGHEEEAKAFQVPTVYRAEDLFLALGVENAGNQTPGFFLSVEGNDGSGKSTQVAMLHDFLLDAGYDVQLTREPGGSPIAESIRNIVLDPKNTAIQDMTEAYLYAASRAQHVRDIIFPALEAGRVLVCDRFVDSSIAYQGAGRELGLDLVEQLNQPAIGGCMPQLTLLLQIDSGIALMRRLSASQADRLEALDDAFHRRVESAFTQLARKYPERIKPVRADRPADEIAEDIRLLVCDTLNRAGIA